MLNIESELRSLRNELEDRNKIFRETPPGTGICKPQEVNKCHDEPNEQFQTSPEDKGIENNAIAEKIPSGDKLIESPSDSSCYDQMVNTLIRHYDRNIYE